MTLPNFIIAGAPKSGTTALWGYLAEHPHVFLAAYKEPRFFTEVPGQLERGVIGSGPNRGGRYSDGLSWYESLYRKYGGQSAVGEASTEYFAAPDAPDLMLRHVPDVRLIFLLRDPVERAYSHYWQEYRLGWPLPPFSRMVHSDHARLRYYLHVSQYAEHLDRYLRRFPLPRICILTFDELRSDPARTLSCVCRFLGIDSEFRPHSLGTPFNEQKLPRNRRLQRFLSALQGSSVRRALPPPMRPAIRALRRQIDRWNLVPNRYAPLTPEIRQRLAPRFERDIGFVEELTGLALDSWRRTAGDQRNHEVDSL